MFFSWYNGRGQEQVTTVCLKVCVKLQHAVAWLYEVIMECIAAFPHCTPSLCAAARSAWQDSTAARSSEQQHSQQGFAWEEQPGCECGTEQLLAWERLLKR